MPLDPTRPDHYAAPARARAEALAARAPRPARIGNVRLGTCSWTDPTLIKSGLFYPPSANNAERRLRHYAEHFDVVEVDSPYYALPTVQAASAWAARTPPGFRFHVKAFAAITGHPVDLKTLPRDLKDALPPGLRGRRRARPDELPPDLVGACWRRFADALEPLTRAQKLAAVLLQFPPWFTATRGNARRLVACRQRLPELPLAVEFRHRSWLDPARRRRVLDLLRDQGMAFVAVDTPAHHDTALQRAVEVTSPDLAVVRFHGRNPDTWSGATTAAERFDHLYEEDELAEWLEPLRRLAGQAAEVHALMNNCAFDAGILGAKNLAALLAEDSRG